MSNETMTLLMLASIIPIILFTFCLTMVFSIASPKFVRHPYEDQLERTDNPWLAIVSPFHMPSTEAYYRVSNFGKLQPEWLDFIRCFIVETLWSIAYVVMLPISIVGGAIYMMAGIIWAIISGIGKRIKKSCWALTKMIR